jgi:UDP-2,3-diacylglucosamine hydrolase
MAAQWFISDLHLASERIETVELFERFMRDRPQRTDRVYILGDLFDVWIGDDDDAPLANRVRNILRQTVDRGVDIAIQRGNRDFLMGHRLMASCGATLLPDCHVTPVGGQDTLLMHGDLLCTDDLDYQKARRRFRNPLFQWLMLRRSLRSRRRIAQDYRRRSGNATAAKSAEIMDVNNDTVIDYLEKYRVHRLIHGHTHRPAIHQHLLHDGSHATRLVLPEWHGDHAVAWRDDGSRLEPVHNR